MTTEAENFQIQVRWPRDVVADAQFANQVAVGPAAGTPTGEPEGGVYVIFGHVAPPLIGDPAEMERFMSEGGILPISPRGTFYLPKVRATELFMMLGQQLGLIGGEASE